MSTTDAMSTVHPVPKATSSVLVATADGLARAPGTATELPGRAVTGFALDEDVGWALVDRRELHRLTDTGPALVASLDRPVATCVHVHAGTVYVGGDEARLWELRDWSLQPVRSFDEAPTRPDWHTPWGGPPSVFTMASHGDDLYVSVHVGGILHSADGARTWAATIDLHEDVHQVAVDPATGTVWAATGMAGLAESTDRGRSWRHHTEGLHATYLLAVATTSAGVLVAASSGHAGRDGAVYLFDGSTFARPEGLPERLDGAVEPRHLAGAGDDAALLAPDGSLYTSDDGGRRWRLVGGPFPSPTEVRIAATTTFAPAGEGPR